MLSFGQRIAIINMKRKYRLKKRADNDYTAQTGKEAYTLHGGSACVVAVYKMFGNLTCQQYAYYIFNLKDLNLPFNTKIKVSSTCGATNCVNRDHLVAVYKPSKENQQYITDYLKTDGISVIAHNLQVSKELLQTYLDISK